MPRWKSIFKGLDDFVRVLPDPGDTEDPGALGLECRACVVVSLQSLSVIQEELDQVAQVLLLRFLVHPFLCTKG